MKKPGPISPGWSCPSLSRLQLTREQRRSKIWIDNDWVVSASTRLLGIAFFRVIAVRVALAIQAHSVRTVADRSRENLNRVSRTLHNVGGRFAFRHGELHRPRCAVRVIHGPCDSRPPIDKAPRELRAKATHRPRREITHHGTVDRQRNHCRRRVPEQHHSIMAKQEPVRANLRRSGFDLGRGRSPARGYGTQARVGRDAAQQSNANDPTKLSIIEFAPFATPRLSGNTPVRLFVLTLGLGFNASIHITHKRGCHAREFVGYLVIEFVMEPI